MKRYFIIQLFFLGVLFLSCESDKDKEWGYSKIYMPQAILQSGGTTANFTVKVNLNDVSDTAVVVGVYRSGLEELCAFSVDLEISTDTLFAAIDIANTPDASNVYDIYKTAQLLPDSYYTLPSKIHVANGERESSVKLLLNRNSLNNDDFFTTSGNRYILPVCISNPTRYMLNKELSITMFVFEKQ